MADKLCQDFGENFPYGYFVNLGDGFPTSSYPFSQTRFSEAKAATHRSRSVKVTTYLFVVIFTPWLVRHPHGTRTATCICYSYESQKSS